jgi:nucleotide-binding universal stress UspA family protein
MSTIVIGLRPGEDPSKLLDLTRGHVAAGSTLHLVSYVTISAEENVHPRLERAQEWADGVASQLAAEGYVAQAHVDVSVTPGGDLLNVAEAVDADLIVIGLSKRTRVGKALLGSDAQRVLLSADRPVLCLRIG